MRDVAHGDDHIEASVGGPHSSGGDGRIRNALESLIHRRPGDSSPGDSSPGDSSPGESSPVESSPTEMMPGSALGAQDAGAAPRGSVVQQAALAPTVVGLLTGLSHAASWTSVLASEEARWTRYQRPCQVVQIEVAGIATVAARLGEAPAETLMALLGAVLREETRQSDLYGRVSRWRIQGVLPEQEPGGGPRYAERVRDAFGRRLGPDLHLGLVIGMAAPTATGGFSEGVRAADRAMRQVGQLDRGVAPAGLIPSPDHRGPSAVRDGLIELGLLLRDGLISDEEHRMTRAEILGRL